MLPLSIQPLKTLLKFLIGKPTHILCKLLKKRIKNVLYKLGVNKLRFPLKKLVFYLENKKRIRQNLLHQHQFKCDFYHYYEIKMKSLEPKWLKDHRTYFSSDNRGFGEDAFHAAWKDIIETFRPKSALEIGVYRGQTLSLWQLIAEKRNMTIEIWGASPLSNIGDSVSEYIHINYEADIAKNFAFFGLKPPKLFQTKSTERVFSEFIRKRKWDLIYIDGNHDFEVVYSDYMLALANLELGGILCLDDSSLYLDFPIMGQFKGHSGPSQVVSKFAMTDLNYLMTVGHNNFFQKVRK